jgi:hypothetical protein
VPGLGRIPKEFRAYHTCDHCDAFAPLWDLTYGKWCDDCVKNSGGIVKAANGLRDEFMTRDAERLATATAAREAQAKVLAKNPPQRKLSREQKLAIAAEGPPLEDEPEPEPQVSVASSPIDW